MGLVKVSKVGREITRIREQLSAWLARMYEPILKRMHDSWRQRQPEPQDLGVALDKKVAIFLIYQPTKISSSTFATLRWLGANGYAPLIISNAPILISDRNKLKELAWRIFERPNFGYDFGGYRDGVLLLRSWGILPQRLLILNDSVWMPTRIDSSLISRLESLKVDIAGGIMQPELRRNMQRTRRAYLESYLYLINSSGFSTPTFFSFWQKYPASSKKRNAVLRGERRFTCKMQDGGLTVAGLFSASSFLEENFRQNNIFLRNMLKYAAYVNSKDYAQGRFLLENYSPDKDWHTHAMDHIRSATALYQFNAVFPYSSDVLFGIDFIKKRSTVSIGMGALLHSKMRCQLLRAASEGEIRPLAQEIQSEMEAVEAKI